MKIVILDGYVANSGDLSWQPIAELGELVVYDRTTPDQIVERAADADAVFTNKVVFDKEVFDQLPRLKFVGVLATGFNNVDVVAARRHGVTVCNVPAYSTESVVQTIFAHLLNITNHVQKHSDAVHNGQWTSCEDFSFRLTPMVQLAGMTMGIYGLGHIGQLVARVANAFEMKVCALTSKVPWQLPGYITPVEKDELFAKSDVLVLCAPLTEQNRRFVNAQTLALMKPTAIIINTARGGMVDSYALASALESGQIAAAGVDVLDQEPPKADEPLLTAKNCFITPHYAWQSNVARARLIEISADNLRSFMAGDPINVVN